MYRAIQGSESIHHKLAFVKETLKLKELDEVFIVTDTVLTR